MSEHYICTGGCKGISEKQGTCQSPDCPKYTKELTKCDCADNRHQSSDEE